MKILICGSGSIAIRHFKNLKKLGHKNIFFFKSTLRHNKNSVIPRNKIFYDLNEALNENPDIAFICNNTNIHVDTAIKCAKKKCHIFMEKPISHSLKNIKLLKKIIITNKLVFFVGYMIRFHPLIIKIKNLIKQKKFSSKVFYATSIWGEYLPDWHPNENYKQSYASNKSLGGGVSLTLSHELDLMSHLFGKIKFVKSLKKYKSDLKINVDVASTYLIRFISGVDCNIHINYLNKPPTRDLKIFGENLQIFFDYYSSVLLIIKDNKKYKYSLKNFDRNQMFINEIKYFFKILKSKKFYNSEEDFNKIKYFLK